MKRSALLAGVMVLAAASSAAAQGRLNFNSSPQARAAPQRSALQPTQYSVCPAGSYSIVRAPDGSSVSVLFNDMQLTSEGEGPAVQQSRCRIEVPLILPAGYGAGLTTVDYRGFALLAQQQSAEIAVDYEVGSGNRAPRFQRRLQGQYEGDFAFTDRLPPGRLRWAGCVVRRGPPPVLVIDAALTLSSGGRPSPAMVSLDSADQASRALTYRFQVRPCDRLSAAWRPNQN